MSNKVNILDILQPDPRDYYLYSVSSRDYYIRALHNFDKSCEEKHFLFYSALECRYAIEMLLKEYMAALSGLQGIRNIGKHKPATLRREIQAKEPYLQEKVRFVAALVKAKRGDLIYPILDLNLINKHYESLNKYLHTSHLPPNLIEADWWKIFRNEIDTILDQIWPVVDGPKVKIVSNEKGLKLFHRFRKGELTDEDIIRIAHANAWEGAEIEVNFRQFPQE